MASQDKRMSEPEVKIDIKVKEDGTVITVLPAANEHKKLLEVVQVLTHLDLTIKYANISSPNDSSFNHEFHVIDRNGEEVTDQRVLTAIRELKLPVPDVKPEQLPGCTSFKIKGSDRPGFLSEVLDVLITHDEYNVVNAEVWTDDTSTKGVMQVTDKESTGGGITDTSKIEKVLRNVLNGSNKSRRDSTVEFQRPFVDVLSQDTSYSEVDILSKKRPKLLFDVVRTLTDMQYVVYHGDVCNEGSESYRQKYKIKHVEANNHEINPAKKRWLVHNLEAAIEGRVSEAIKLELCTDHNDNIFGLLSEITNILQVDLKLIKAEVTTRSSKAVCTFYVCHREPGRTVDSKITDPISKAIRETIFKGVDPKGKKITG